jgi:hypothetical protein
MKKHIKRLSIILLPCLLFLSATLPPVFPEASSDPIHSRGGGDDEVTKKKTINKSYNVTATDKLDIDNQFGDVMISTWDKDQITVDIEISAKGATEDKATETLNQINVEDSQKDKTISFKTYIGLTHNGDGENKQNDDKNNDDRSEDKHKDKDKAGKQRSNRHFSINYIVHMPAVNPLHIKDQFGKIVVPDLKGSVNLYSQFGGLTAGKLANVEAIHVEFGSATIGEISNGKLNLSFNGPTAVRKIGGNVKVVIEFSSLVQLGLDDNIGELSVIESYSDVRMVLARDFSADFNIHTSYGDLHNDSGINMQEQKDSDSGMMPRFDKDFQGRSGDGKAKISVKSSYGNVSLSHDWHGETT